jgi:integral membrane sensor domain MASE1
VTARAASISTFLRYGVLFGAVTAAYYGTAKVGLALAFAQSSMTAVWAPTGIALAALLLWGYRLWPAVALGAFLANLGTGIPLLVVFGITPETRSRPSWARGFCRSSASGGPSTVSGTF